MTPYKGIYVRSLIITLPSDFEYSIILYTVAKVVTPTRISVSALYRLIALGSLIIKNAKLKNAGSWSNFKMKNIQNAMQNSIETVPIIVFRVCKFDFNVCNQILLIQPALFTILSGSGSRRFTVILLALQCLITFLQNFFVWRY